jgi:hypothetical protein
MGTFFITVVYSLAKGFRSHPITTAPVMSRKHADTPLYLFAGEIGRTAAMPGT